MKSFPDVQNFVSVWRQRGTTQGIECPPLDNLTDDAGNADISRAWLVENPQTEGFYSVTHVPIAAHLLRNNL